MQLKNLFEALKHSDYEDVVETWNKIKGVYLETAKNILGFRGIKKIRSQKKHGQNFKNGKI
jgi:hypothetical protein